jgi:hypothetical protein
MTNFVARLLGRAAPTFSEARAGDATAIAAVHGASFQRGWGEDEIHRLLIESNVVVHRAMIGRTLIGFILSRMAAGEAEILSVAIAPAWRGRAFARPCSICICADWPALAPARYFSRSASIMRQPAGSTGEPVFTKSAGARVIMRAVRRPSYCAATSANAHSFLPGIPIRRRV